MSALDSPIATRLALTARNLRAMTLATTLATLGTAHAKM
jgi:hypothetical protein